MDNTKNAKLDAETQKKVEILSTIAQAYPNTKITPQGIAVMVSALKNVPSQALNMAMQRILQTSRFFPTVADIYDTLSSLEHTLNPKKFPPSVEDAWKDVQNQVNNYRPGHPPVFIHPAIKKAVDYIGWLTFRTVLEKDVGILRAQFRDSYKNIVLNLEEKRQNELILGKAFFTIESKKEIKAKPVEVTAKEGDAR